MKVFTFSWAILRSCWKVLLIQFVYRQRLRLTIFIEFIVVLEIWNYQFFNPSPSASSSSSSYASIPSPLPPPSFINIHLLKPPPTIFLASRYSTTSNNLVSFCYPITQHFLNVHILISISSDVGFWKWYWPRNKCKNMFYLGILYPFITPFKNNYRIIHW